MKYAHQASSLTFEVNEATYRRPKLQATKSNFRKMHSIHEVDVDRLFKLTLTQGLKQVKK